jgi:hypothetical protein
MTHTTGEFDRDVPVGMTLSNENTSLVVITLMLDVSLTDREEDNPDVLMHVIVESEVQVVASDAVKCILDRKVLSKYPKLTA